MKSPLLALTSLAALAPALSQAAKTAAPAKTATGDKPNFVVILVDDLGFADFGCYGGMIPTPNIDALAQQGVRMSQMYNCARSCPTRASILTGLYPQQAGIGHMVGGNRGKESAAYQGFLNDRCVTLAEVMGAGGYFTAVSGKWHVGQKQGATPWGRGFKRSMNAVGGGFYYGDDPSAEVFLNGELVTNSDPRVGSNWYSTDLWTDYAIQFVGEAVDARQPFMLYLAYNAPHFPLQVPGDEVAAFKGQFSRGWDQMRQEYYQHQVDMNLLGETYELTPRNPLIPDWKDVDPAQKRRSEHTMEIYAAVVAHLDAAIGRVVADLKARGVFDNTVIMLLSDNGGNAEGKTVYGTYGGPNQGALGSNVYLGQAWAEVSNTPFFLYKHHTHEGGIATPLIACWPAGIPAAHNGSIVHQPGHVIDVMATLVSLSGVKYPETFKGKAITPMQGINLLPLWMGGAPARKQPLFWEHENNLALREGKWKLVKERNEDGWELYDMDADRTEMHNLAASESEVLKRMQAGLREMYKMTGTTYFDFESAPRWFVPVEDYTKTN